MKQGGHGTGKTGNLVLTFCRQGKHREFCSGTGKNLLTQGKYLDCDINIKSMLIFLNFKFFSLALLSIIFNFKVLCVFVPHMLCIPMLPVYFLSVSVYSYIIFIWDMKQTDVRGGV